MIIVDVETTGLDPSRHSIIDIAAMEFGNPTNFFHSECRMRDGAEIGPIALEINGFTEADITDPDKPTLWTAMMLFLDWTKEIEDRTIAGQNPDFDLNFLKESARYYGLDWNLGYRSFDQHSLVYFDFLRRDLDPPLDKNVSNLKSDEIMKYVGICPEPRPHKAPNGVRWEAEAFSRLIYGKNLLPKFKDHPVPEYLIK